MSARVYVLLDVMEGRANQVAKSLRSKCGVLMADVLENPSDVIVVVEAPERQRLTELVLRARTRGNK